MYLHNTSHSNPAWISFIFVWNPIHFGMRMMKRKFILRISVRLNPQQDVFTNYILSFCDEKFGLIAILIIRISRIIWLRRSVATVSSRHRHRMGIHFSDQLIRCLVLLFGWINQIVTGNEFHWRKQCWQTFCVRNQSIDDRTRSMQQYHRKHIQIPHRLI